MMLEVFSARHAAECGNGVFDLRRVVFIGGGAGLELVEEIGTKPRAVGHFMSRQFGVDACDVQLLAQTRPWCSGGVFHESVVTPPYIAQRHDH
jgi:hypothetical protein